MLCSRDEDDMREMEGERQAGREGARTKERVKRKAPFTEKAFGESGAAHHPLTASRKLMTETEVASNSPLLTTTDPSEHDGSTYPLHLLRMHGLSSRIFHP